VETEVAAARLVGADPSLWQTYGQWVATFHPAAVEEMRAMARTAGRKFKAHLEPLIELLGMQEVIRQVGLKRVLDQVGPQQVIAEMAWTGCLPS
jgi:hypothetical protein